MEVKVNVESSTIKFCRAFDIKKKNFEEFRKVYNGYDSIMVSTKVSAVTRKETT